MAKGFKFKKKHKNKWKRYAGIVHLWLGLISGIVVFIMAITGCIFVFQDEIKDVVFDWRHIEPQNKSFVAPSIILDNVQKRFKDSEANMVVYQNKIRPATVSVILDNISYDIFLNPYTGEITHLQNLDSDFFITVETLLVFFSFQNL